MLDLVGHDRIIDNRSGEFVAAQPREQGIGGQDVAHPLRSLGEDGIADIVTVEVVDLFEIVEIDQDHRQRPAFALGLGEELGHGRGDAAAVVAAGKRVDFSEPPGFLFRAAAIAQFGMHRLVAVPAQQDQGDVEQERIGQQQIGLFGQPAPRADQLGHDRSTGANEKDDRSGGDAERDDVPFPAAGLGEFIGHRLAE